MGAPVGPAEGKAIKILGWPELSGDEFLDDRYVSYWRKATGIGLLCGEPSGIICLDVDLDKVKDSDLLAVIEAEIPPIKSGKIGNPNRRPAQFFRFNGELPRKFKNIAVEILSTGNQTILPPSGHPTFDTYSWVGTPLFELSDIDELPCLPPSLIPFLNDLDNSMIGPAVSSPVGGRNNQLKSMCGAMFDKGKHVEAVAQELFLYDQTHHKPPLFSDASEFKNGDAKWNALSFATSVFKSYLNSKQAKGETIPHLTTLQTPAPAEPDADGVTTKSECEQVGFYAFNKNKDGVVKVAPLYLEMAEWCFSKKDLCFDDTVSLKFDGKKWKWFSKTAMHNFIIEVNRRHIKPAHLDNFVKAIKGKCFTEAVGVKQPDALINLENGTLNVKTKTLLTHSHEWLFKYCSPVKFDPNSECPTWNEFLLTVFNKNIELCDLAQRLFGYILIGGRPFLHRAFVLYGSGRNGKSTFLDVLRAVIGSDAYSTVSMSKLDKEFSIVNLDGKLANIVEETPNDEINAEVFKTLVAGGEIQAAHKGFDEYTFRCAARFVFACNDLPVFRDRTIGLEDRLVFMPFDRYFEEHERDPQMLDKLLTELPGILNWALEGVETIIRHPVIPDYDVLRKSKEHYRIETNPVYSWFMDNVEVCRSGDQISIADVYSRYVQDTKADGNRSFSKDKFMKQFRKHLAKECEKNSVHYDPALRDASGSIRVFDSFKWRRQNAVRKSDSSDSSGQHSLEQLSDKNIWYNR